MFFTVRIKIEVLIKANSIIFGNEEMQYLNKVKKENPKTTVDDTKIKEQRKTKY